MASVLGLATAVLIAYSRTMEKALYPIVLFAQVIPKIAIAPLIVVWFGNDLAPKIILAVLIAFFPVVVSGVAGLRSTDPELLELSATMGASRWQTFRKIRFPNALPHLMAGEKVAVTLAVVGAVVGEFVGASEGLGYQLMIANGNLDAPLLFAALILMSLIGILLFVIVEVAGGAAHPVARQPPLRHPAHHFLKGQTHDASVYSTGLAAATLLVVGCAPSGQNNDDNAGQDAEGPPARR